MHLYGWRGCRVTRTLSNDPMEVERRDPRVREAQDAEQRNWRGTVTERVAEAEQRQAAGTR